MIVLFVELELWLQNYKRRINMKFIKSKVKEHTPMDTVELLTMLKNTDTIIVVKTEHKSIKARLKDCDIYENLYGHITIDAEREV